MKKVTIKMIALVIALFAVHNSGAQNNFLNVIRGENGKTNPFTRLLPEQQVAFAPSEAKTLLGLDRDADLVLIRTEPDQIGEIHYRFYQTYQGIQVENTMYIVHTKNGMLTGMSGSIILDFDKKSVQSSTASLTDTKAIETALKFVHAQQYAWQDADFEQGLKNQSGKANATYYPSATLAWYSAGDEINSQDFHLCYKVDIYALQPLSRAYYFVDAQNGNIRGQKDEYFYSDATGTCNTVYSGTQTIHSDFTGSTYRLHDLTKGNGVITLHASSGHADYTNSSATWNLSGADQYALDAHYGVSQTWSFYKTNFNRNSVDDAGFALTSYVNETSTVNNAGWDGSIMHFGVRSGTGAGITAIDVTGHELTHGVTQYTSGLNYSNQSGAMNESMSDIFGKSVQFWSKPNDVNWLLSNDMSWNIRNMANPNQFSQPDTYLGTNWYTGSADNGGVHTNSGVGNFMFYLLVTGGSGTNDIGNSYTVSGIGLAEADAILYRSQTTYLTPTSQYSNWRTACINAATDLYGASSNEVIQVENAWYAVGIGTAGGTGCSDTHEPNNTRVTATVVSVNAIQNGLITPSGDLDFFKITTVAPMTNLQLTLSNLPANYNMQLKNTSGTTLAAASHSGLVNEVIKYNTSSASTYIIRIYGTSGANNATQCYNLNIQASNTPFRVVDEEESGNEIDASNIKFYPNPAQDNLSVEFNSNIASNKLLNVYSLIGQKIISDDFSIVEGINTIRLNTSKLDKGVYILEMENNGEISHFKFTISR